jgi:hypothetical protein
LSLTWPAAFAITTLVEIPIVVAGTRAVPARPTSRALTAFGAQLLTHPVVWFVFPRLAWLSISASLGLSELWAWLLEAGVYAVVFPRLSPLSALGLSAFANGASVWFGLLASVWESGQ